jgi:putative flippase GtrA
LASFRFAVEAAPPAKLTRMGGPDMLERPAMTDRNRPRARLPAFLAMLEPRLAIIRKAASFALVGVVNAIIDAGLFFLAYGWLTSQTWSLGLLSALAETCGCGTASGIGLVTANLFGWFVAVSMSYVMNSYTTFAAESGRQLKFAMWGKFVASGILGVAANTVTLVIAAQFVPVWIAKGISILVGFLVNFSMSHFVVFGAKAQARHDTAGRK